VLVPGLFPEGVARWTQGRAPIEATVTAAAAGLCGSRATASRKNENWGTRTNDLDRLAQYDAQALSSASCSHLALQDKCPEGAPGGWGAFTIFRRYREAPFSARQDRERTVPEAD